MMTSKERVMAALDWRETDRVPLQIYLTPEIAQGLQDYFAARPGQFPSRDINEVLGIDFRGVGPDSHVKVKDSHDGIIYDMWGTGFRVVQHGSSGTYFEPEVLPLAALSTLDEVEQYPWPDAEKDFDYSVIAEQCERFEDFAIMTGNPGMPDIINGTSRCRGMEQVLLDIVTRDEVGMAIIDKRVDVCYEILRRSLQAAGGKIDILSIGEDLGNQNGMMVSWRDFSEVFRPRLQRFIDLAHEFGAKAMMHCCGDSHQLMPAFIEMGLDILDAMQPEPPGMNPEKIRSVCKGKMAFCGLISTQDTLPFHSVAECRAEARHRLDAIAPGGGYIFSPAHCIQAGTPVENVLAIYEEALGKQLIFP